jgi:hypothetical protein
LSGVFDARKMSGFVMRFPSKGIITIYRGIQKSVSEERIFR